ncbi:hypothetical protein [Aliarcobacter butzleri]|uniref:hypothetical protein n=1 Tax=Aliarcobacter butzleri TaxID=28197 RepID=UPI00126A3F48|nr:hypothetical protein [Aliarcobacter butzleri]
MKKILKIGLVSCCALIALSGCSSKEEKVIVTLSYNEAPIVIEGSNENTFTRNGMKVSLKDLKPCSDKKVIEEQNDMTKQDVVIEGSNEIISAELGTAYKIEGCIEKDDKNQETIVIDFEFKHNYIY